MNKEKQTLYNIGRMYVQMVEIGYQYADAQLDKDMDKCLEKLGDIQEIQFQIIDEYNAYRKIVG